MFRTAVHDFATASKLARALGGVGTRYQAITPAPGYGLDQVVRFPSIGGYHTSGPITESLDEAIAQADDHATAVIVRDASPSFWIHGAIEIAR